MCLDQPAPPVQDERVLAAGGRSDDRIDQKASLSLEVLGGPRDISYIEPSFVGSRRCRPSVEPANELVLPAIRGEWLGGNADRAQHAGRHPIGDQELDTGPEAAIRENEHDASYQTGPT